VIADGCFTTSLPIGTPRAACKPKQDLADRLLALNELLSEHESLLRNQALLLSVEARLARTRHASARAEELAKHTMERVREMASRAAVMNSR
jgi:hypothetical protein